MSETLPIIYEPSSAHLLYGLFEEDVISVSVYCSIAARTGNSIQAYSYIGVFISLRSYALLAFTQIRGTVRRTIRPEFARFRKPSTFHVGIQSNGEEQLELVDADKEQRYVGHCLKNDTVQGMAVGTPVEETGMISCAPDCRLHRSTHQPMHTPSLLSSRICPWITAVLLERTAPDGSRYLALIPLHSKYKFVQESIAQPATEMMKQRDLDAQSALRSFSRRRGSMAAAPGAAQPVEEQSDAEPLSDASDYREFMLSGDKARALTKLKAAGNRQNAAEGQAYDATYAAADDRVAEEEVLIEQAEVRALPCSGNTSCVAYPRTGTLPATPCAFTGCGRSR